MEITLGNLKLNTSPALGDAAFEPYILKNPEMLGRKPFDVYFWDCRRAPNGNPPRPPNFTVPTNLCLSVLTPSAKVNNTATVAAARRLLAATGAANLRALDRQLTTAFPPLTVPIPWQQLSRNFSARNSINIHAWVGYRDMWLTPKNGQPRDRYILSVPFIVRFVAVWVDVCAIGMGSHILIAIPDQVRTVAGTPAKGKPKDFSDEYDRELRDATRRDPERMRRLKDRLKRAAEKRQRDHADAMAFDEDDF